MIVFISPWVSYDIKYHWRLFVNGSFPMKRTHLGYSVRTIPWKDIKTTTLSKVTIEQWCIATRYQRRFSTMLNTFSSYYDMFITVSPVSVYSLLFGLWLIFCVYYCLQLFYGYFSVWPSYNHKVQLIIAMSCYLCTYNTISLQTPNTNSLQTKRKKSIKISTSFLHHTIL